MPRIRLNMKLVTIRGKKEYDWELEGTLEEIEMLQKIIQGASI